MAETIGGPENTKELVQDFLRKAKELEYLITSLPSPPPPTSTTSTSTTTTTGEEEDKELEELQAELEGVNREYKEAVSVARSSFFRPSFCWGRD